MSQNRLNFFIVLIVLCNFSILQAQENSDYQDNVDKSKESAEQQQIESKEEKSPVEKNKEKQEDKKPEPEKLLKVGNLAFPVAQQPTPLVSFGQNLIEEKKFEIQEVVTHFRGKKNYFLDIATGLIYSFKDNVSIYINMPNAIRFRQESHHSSGPEDLLIQFEYAPYTKEYYTYYDQISIVANVTIPTGSVRKTPITGKGANSLFIGAVYSRMSTDWFYYTSYGYIFNTSSHQTKFGDQFLYQYGVGNRIFSNKEWLFDWMVEIDGQYINQTEIRGVKDLNSGSNIMYVTPSLFLASKESLVLQGGIGFPVVQQLFGHQLKQKYLLQIKVSWNF